MHTLKTIIAVLLLWVSPLAHSEECLPYSEQAYPAKAVDKLSTHYLCRFTDSVEFSTIEAATQAAGGGQGLLACLCGIGSIPIEDGGGLIQSVIHLERTAKGVVSFAKNPKSTVHEIMSSYGDDFKSAGPELKEAMICNAVSNIILLGVGVTEAVKAAKVAIEASKGAEAAEVAGKMAKAGKFVTDTSKTDALVANAVKAQQVIDVAVQTGSKFRSLDEFRNFLFKQPGFSQASERFGRAMAAARDTSDPALRASKIAEANAARAVMNQMSLDALGAPPNGPLARELLEISK